MPESDGGGQPFSPHASRTAPTTALAIVTYAIFADMLLYGLVVPILPTYATGLGAAEWQIGVLFGGYALGLLVATPLLGPLADRVGRRWPMAGGLLGLALTTLLFASAVDYLPLLAARVLQGVAASVTWTTGLALLADLYPTESRGSAMGVALSGMTAGTLVGPPVGGWLYEWGGYQLPFVLAALLAIAGAVAAAVRLTDPPRGDEAPVSPLDLLRDRTVLVVTGVGVIGAACWGMLEPVLPLHLETRLGAGPVTVGLLFGLATLAYGAASPLVGALSDRHGRRPAVALGLVLLAVTLPAVGLAPSLPTVGAALMLVAVAYGFAMTPTLPQLADLVDARGKGGYAAAYALFNEAYGVGMMAGPMLGGVLTSLFGLPVALAAMGLIALGYLLVVRVGWPAGPR